MRTALRALISRVPAETDSLYCFAPATSRDNPAIAFVVLLQCAFAPLPSAASAASRKAARKRQAFSPARFWSRLEPLLSCRSSSSSEAQRICRQLPVRPCWQGRRQAPSLSHFLDPPLLPLSRESLSSFEAGQPSSQVLFWPGVRTSYLFFRSSSPVRYRRRRPTGRLQWPFWRRLSVQAPLGPPGRSVPGGRPAAA